MISTLLGVFLILHGIVHLLYAGQSWRLFELQSGMVWADGSWTLARILGDGTTRRLAGILLLMAAMAFIAGSIGLFIPQDWWRPVIVAASLFSSMIYILLWDGVFQDMDGKGGIGIIINAMILTAVLLLQQSDIKL